MQTSKDKDTYLVLDVNWREKALSLTYSGAAGSIAAVASKEVIGAGIKILSLSWLFPEYAAFAVGAIAFSHTAHATCDQWNRHIRPHDLVLREKRRPKIDI